MKVSYIELLEKRHPLCFSMTASAELDEAFGGLEAMADKIQNGNLSQRVRAVNSALQILLKAGRIYVSACGGDLPDPLPCAPADLIDVTDGAAVKAIFSAISNDTDREVLTVQKNGEAAQDR